MLCPTLNTSLAFTFFLFVCLHTSYCQQEYVDTKGLTCSSANFTPRGYLCNGPQTCMSFVSFRATPPYDSATNISYLFDSDSSNIVLFNKLSSTNERIPFNQLVKVPVSCSCSGSLYQHNTPYTVLAGDTYISISKITFQGLTRCEYLDSQNYYLPTNLTTGVGVVVPIQCACPTANQTTQGIISLLTHVPAEGETLHDIGGNFSVTVESIIEANMIPANRTIYPDLPVLVPLSSQSCKENPDVFYCYCSKGYILDASTKRFRCVDDDKKFPTKSVAIIGLSIVLVLLCFSIVTFQSYKYLKKRRERIRKEKLFEQNGGLLLQQKCSIYGSNESSKIFSAEELQRATDNFNKSRFLGQGGFGSVYKGMLPDGTIVAVKRSNAIDKSRIERFINEIVILSQINHRNIVKLLGCCLEIESPLLVYEYISNGTLSHHIHSQDPKYFLSWEDRLRIACEVAGAVAYMHSAASTPIFHRDIKPSNILLDEKRISKVSDFGTSRSLPYNKTHLTTAIQGTFGYMDPEYLQSSHFTDKSDVYSFGVVLVELLTSKKPFSFSNDEGEGGLNLVANFISLVKENSVLGIIDNRVAMEAKEEELLAVAMLAKRCLRLNNKKRPTMKEVAMELEGLKRSQRCLEIQQSQPLNYNDDERSLLQSETPSCAMSFSGSFIGR